MTPSQPGAELRFGGRRTSDILREGLDELVEAVIETLAEQIELYGALPSEALAGDITAVVRRNLRLFVAALQRREPPGPGDLDEIRYSAARRAEERIPLELMLRAYPVGARAVFERATADATPEDLSSMREAVVLLLDFLGQVMGAAADGYLDEHQMIVGAAESNEQRLLDALLRGAFEPVTADATPLEIPPAFDVCAIAVDAHPDEREPGIDAAIAARRKLRRLHAELRRRRPDQVLSSLTSDGGIVLLAVDDPDGAAGSGLDVDALSAAAGVAVTAAVARAVPTSVPLALQEAREVLQLVRWLGLPPARYRLDDLLVEYQLTRPGPARRRLAERLVPIAPDDELVATLRAFLAHGGNRRRAALDLHVHPNTIDYRNAKIRRLTGLDPTQPDDGYQLRTALIAHDAERATGGLDP